MAQQFAPSFETAREQLYLKLHYLKFGKMSRDCVVPQDAREVIAGEEVVTYFHGRASHIPIGQDRGEGSIWFKKPLMARNAFTLGPVRLEVDPNCIPRRGDILMGPTGPNKDRGLLFRHWYPGGGPICSLFRVVLEGTNKSEAQLYFDMKIQRQELTDQVWALARLVSFGNVQAFAKQHLGTLGREKPMDIGDVPTFVSECAYEFGDESIWEAFHALAPVDRPSRPQYEQPVSHAIVKPLDLSNIQQPPQFSDQMVDQLVAYATQAPRVQPPAHNVFAQRQEEHYRQECGGYSQQYGAYQHSQGLGYDQRWHEPPQTPYTPKSPDVTPPPSPRAAPRPSYNQIVFGDDSGAILPSDSDSDEIQVTM